MKWITLGWLIPVLGLATACHDLPEGGDSPMANGPAGPDVPPLTSVEIPAPATPPPAPYGVDRMTAKTVRRTLKEDPALSPLCKGVTVSVYKGIVTLGGTVPDAGARLRIVEAIEKLPGVDQVRDRTTVKAD